MIIEAAGMLRASEEAVVDATIGRRPGVIEVDANPVSQTATVVSNPEQSSLEDPRRWITE